MAGARSVAASLPLAPGEPRPAPASAAAMAPTTTSTAANAGTAAASAPGRRPWLQLASAGSAGSAAPTRPSRAARLARRWRSRVLPGVLGLASIGLLLLAWHLATTYRLDFYVRFSNIPTPIEVFDKLLEVNQSPKFVTNVGISLRRILLGFAGAAVSGVTLGVLIGRYRLLRMISLPALEVLRPIPAIAWVPMAIMLWPDNEVSIVFITFLGAFFPVLINTIHGVEAVDPVLLRAARSLGAGERSLLWHVVLPGALPQVFTGLSVGMGVAWVSLIAAEMISGQFGVGYFTWEAYSLISYAEIALGMITIGALGLLCSGLIRLAGTWAMPWLAHRAPGGSQS